MKTDNAAIGGLKKLVSYLKPGGVSPEKNDQLVAWGFGEQGIHVKSVDATAFSEAIRDVYGKNYQSDYDIAEFEKMVVDEFRGGVIEGRALTDDDALEFFRKLEARRAFSCTVARTLQGACLSNPQGSPLKLGPFTIYHYPSHKQLLTAENAASTMIREGRVEYLIGVEVEAKTNNRAREKADLKFEMFDRLLKYMLGTSTHYSVTVLGAYGRYSQDAYVFENGQLTQGFFNTQGAVQPLTIDHIYFQSPDVGNDLLWNALGDSRATLLHKRLVTAAQWFGDSYGERDRAGAFIKAAIALEVLFTANEKAIVNSSILSSISEAVACLLGENAEDRMAIEKRVKDHYGIRSAVAHAGKNDVTQASLDEFRGLVRQAIAKILHTPELKSMDSIESVNRYLKGLKYSFRAI